jgi:voltage-gated potassium channel Kch
VSTPTGSTPTSRQRSQWPTSQHPSSGEGAASETEPSAAVFLVMRRLRVPLITLVLVFAVSVFGLSLIPGEDGDGNPVRMSVFDAFYFMSYTATTIGFGEIPYAFTYAQRLWVVVCIYLTVVAWAYAIGALLTLLQDRAFRQALSVQHFERKVRRISEPFLIVAGYGQTGAVIVRSFDVLGRQLVVLDSSTEKIEALDLMSYRGDVPGLVADVRSPHQLRRAGLESPQCEGVLALTDDDEANLAVAMAVALLRPDVPVVARTVSPTIAHRMRAFGSPIVINPFDRFGEHLLLLAAGAGELRPHDRGSRPGRAPPCRPRGTRRRTGRWIVLRLRPASGSAVTADLRSAGLDVTVGRAACRSSRRPPATTASWSSRGDGTEPGVLPGPCRRRRSGWSPAPTTTTTNLSLADAPRPQPGPVRHRPPQPAGQRAALRGDGPRRRAGADRAGGPRGVRPSQHAAAVALPAGDARPRGRVGPSSSWRPWWSGPGSTWPTCGRCA